MSKYEYCPKCGSEQAEGVGKYGVLSCDNCGKTSEFVN